ncbi:MULTISPECIES: Sjogren's syndrome/scleroderma autoantigen 1 family protein [Halorussus]|uniref:Sjogren's syndrome/scleroderma autoantigen 1 family protein n=1 Tax=Halorussus TaxID=1070314 RepID=UPI0020A1D49A|nr:Sjogren's syndrome/scleroderma autoantigen 1 family protein [Halorussus vallis]USZ74156.1 hypothetical protein NGM07_11910 [Halorussus vallis]
MSSDDSGFDKEAEREKLREKYEADQKDRENTRRMSELLLQGATMTGKHCNRCGDPIFRYDGQEFCPTCQQAGEAAANAAEADAGTAAADDAADEPDPVDADQAVAATDVSEDADESGDTADETHDGADAGEEPRVEINDVRVAGRRSDRSDTHSGPPSQQRGETDAEGRSDAGDGSRAPRERRGRSAGRHRHGSDARHRHAGASGRRGASARPDDAGPERHAEADLSEARATLVRTATDLARRAEATDDVARARELLAATREAAEALAALDRTNR